MLAKGAGDLTQQFGDDLEYLCETLSVSVSLTSHSLKLFNVIGWILAGREYTSITPRARKTTAPILKEYWTVRGIPLCVVPVSA